MLGTIGGIRAIGFTTRSGSEYGVGEAPPEDPRLSRSAVQKPSQSANGCPEPVQARCRTRLPPSFKAESGVYLLPSVTGGGWPLRKSHTRGANKRPAFTPRIPVSA